MNTVLFDYELPQELIAQTPISPRDQSRLMVVDRVQKTWAHERFFDIVNYLRSGDLLIWNNSKVFKARLYGKLMSRDNETLWNEKREVEIFLVRPKENLGVWQVLARPGRHARMGMRVVFAQDFFCDVLLVEQDGTLLVQFPYDEEAVRTKANIHGHIPIPPYVKDEPHELDTYQTIYAKREGSVAAPTAGFHFTGPVIAALKAKGVQFAEVTLHVGLGTFLPVKTERIEDHTMHSEWIDMPKETAELVNQAKSEGRRVIAVGTTTVRTLEGVARLNNEQHSLHDAKHRPVAHLREYSGEINLFIIPGFQFRIVDAMITNLHLPKSTLLMLTAAFAGDREFMLRCYEEAVQRHYRFFSFGDAMFIH